MILETMRRRDAVLMLVYHDSHVQPARQHAERVLQQVHGAEWEQYMDRVEIAVDTGVGKTSALYTGQRWDVGRAWRYVLRWYHLPRYPALRQSIWTAITDGDGR